MPKIHNSIIQKKNQKTAEKNNFLKELVQIISIYYFKQNR